MMNFAIRKLDQTITTIIAKRETERGCWLRGDDDDDDEVCECKRTLHSYASVCKGMFWKIVIVT